MKTWTMTLSTRFEDPTKYELVEGLIREKMRELLTTAMLIQDRTRPKATIRAYDNVLGAGDVELITEEDNES